MNLPEIPQVDLSDSWLAQAGDSISQGIVDGAAAIGINLSGDAATFGQENRQTQNALPINNTPGDTSANVASSGELPDWRVKLSIPSAWRSQALRAGTGIEILAPLFITDFALVFPYTPTIMLNYQAGYTPIKPVHSNYPFYSYQNSSVQGLSIAGDFTVETVDEGKYWLAAQHYLKSVTKMAYGENATIPTGAPPPIVKLNGYGNHIFKDLPVIVTSWNMELPNDVDYMLIKGFNKDEAGTYVPVRSTMSVSCEIVHSREKIRQFSLEKFIKGDYINTGEFR